MNKNNCFRFLTTYKLLIFGLFTAKTAIAIDQSASSDITIMSSDLNTTIQTLSGHSSSVNGLKILPDGRLASGSADKTIRIWNLTNGTQDMILNGHTSTVRALDVLPNGYLISGGYDSTIRVWNLTNGSLVMNITGGLLNTYVVKTIGENYFVSGGTNQIVQIWDSTNFTCLRNLTNHTNYVNTIELLSDGTIISGSTDQTVIIWDPNSGVQLMNFNPLSLKINVIKEISPQVIAIGTGNNGTVAFYRVNGSQIPVLITKMDFSSQIVIIYYMALATFSTNGLTSKILYAGCNSHFIVFNVTDIDNITYSVLPFAVGTVYSIEKSYSTTTTVLKSSFYTIVAYQDMPYIADNLIDSMQQSNLLGCGFLCTSNSFCLVFVYSQSTQNCSLYKQTPTNSQFVPSLVSQSYIRN